MVSPSAFTIIVQSHELHEAIQSWTTDLDKSQSKRCLATGQGVTSDSDRCIVTTTTDLTGICQCHQPHFLVTNTGASQTRRQRMSVLKTVACHSFLVSLVPKYLHLRLPLSFSNSLQLHKTRCRSDVPPLTPTDDQHASVLSKPAYVLSFQFANSSRRWFWDVFRPIFKTRPESSSTCGDDFGRRTRAWLHLHVSIQHIVRFSEKHMESDLTLPGCKKHRH